jgi:hypothetical protein
LVNRKSIEYANQKNEKEGEKNSEGSAKENSTVLFCKEKEIRVINRSH